MYDPYTNSVHTIVEETFEKEVFADRTVKLHTNWIAKSAVTPYYHLNQGITVMNPQCHIYDSHSINHKP